MDKALVHSQTWTNASLQDAKSKKLTLGWHCYVDIVPGY